jgi:hypothetical protein
MALISDTARNAHMKKRAIAVQQWYKHRARCVQCRSDIAGSFCNVGRAMYYRMRMLQAVKG